MTMTSLFWLLDKITAPLLTALLITPMLRQWNKWKERQEYVAKLAKFGGKRVIVMEDKKAVGSCKLSIEEAEMLENTLANLDNLNVSETKARQLLQSVVSGFKKSVDSVLSRLTRTQEGDFQINL